MCVSWKDWAWAAYCRWMSAEQPSTEPVPIPAGPFDWHRVLASDELPPGRVTTVTVGRRSLAVSNSDGAYGAIDNHCPHQGGPLGEGSIEQGWLRCPWHGYDYSPCNARHLVRTATASRRSRWRPVTTGCTWRYLPKAIASAR